ncbi:dTDP-glucose 4,6-dehydratase [Kaistia sp. 32K]|uniref:NAD-dependent epimerase/dehydratase family protein n=1 Tax=Kaistia sp. 32K TaxID=2795690 RepID=UPI001915266F|nr:NAD(P)-dependent oxidoreductase [Kaistia sp. 32K]BCP53733.1 dTDP-glucose 4,6-dehydratase [Kaistia sp. 32K]
MPYHRVLLTGAAGQLGRELRTRLAGRFPVLRLSDIAEMAPAGPGEEVIRCDLADAAAVAELCRDVDAILHFGGQSTEADWDTVLAANIAGSFHLWEGARQAGVRRIVFASSNHAIGMQRRSSRLDHTARAAPDSRYGLSKAFGEDLAALYAYKHGIAALCIRIGSSYAEPADARQLSTWMSFDDLVRMIEVGLAADYTYEIVYGVSDNTSSFWDNSNAERLGYHPADSADRFIDALRDRRSDDPTAERTQGGSFASVDFDGDPDALP